MNEGVLLTEWVGGPEDKYPHIIQAQVWADGQTNPINDEIMESDGVTLQRLFWGDYEGPGAGPRIPMEPVPPDTPKEVFIPVMGRLFIADDVRMFEAEDNRIFEA